MDFTPEKPIYQQIIDLIEERIVSSAWAEGERIPSVRDLGAELQVNPNTAMRAFEKLQMAGVINNQRGIGYFVARGAQNLVTDQRKRDFIQTTLPATFETMQTLGITIEQVDQLFSQWFEGRAT